MNDDHDRLSGKDANQAKDPALPVALPYEPAKGRRGWLKWLKTYGPLVALFSMVIGGGSLAINWSRGAAGGTQLRLENSPNSTIQQNNAGRDFHLHEVHSDPQPSIDKAAKDGMTHLKSYRETKDQSELVKAETLLTYAEQQRPGHDPEITTGLAGIAAAKDDWVGAEAWAQKALNRWPNHPITLENAGWIQMQQGKYEQAEPLLQQAVAGELAPQSAYAKLSSVYIQLGRPVDAKHSLEAALQLATVQKDWKDAAAYENAIKTLQLLLKKHGYE